MKIQPSSAIENGFTAQFTKSVTPMPRQCWRTCCNAPKSTFSSIGMIITQMSRPTGKLTFAISSRPMAWNGRREGLAEQDAGDDAKEHPERQIALEGAHRRRSRAGGEGRCVHWSVRLDAARSRAVLATARPQQQEETGFTGTATGLPLGAALPQQAAVS